MRDYGFWLYWFNPSPRGMVPAVRMEREEGVAGWRGG
jgi:hypothetical protein